MATLRVNRSCQYAGHFNYNTKLTRRNTNANDTRTSHQPRFGRDPVEANGLASWNHSDQVLISQRSGMTLTLTRGLMSGDGE